MHSNRGNSPWSKQIYVDLRSLMKTRIRLGTAYRVNPARPHAALLALLFRGALPPIYALVARQRSCCVCSPDTR